jgi:excisionase family DNA binding protein
VAKNVGRDRLSTVKANGHRRWASTQQVAVYLGVTDRTVRLMADDGRLKKYYLGPKLVRYDLNEVDAAFAPKESV